MKQYPSLKRFIKYSTIGVGTFLLDLGLLFVLTDTFQMYYVVAAAVSFLLAVSLNYVISRKMVFKNTRTSFKAGYLNFIVIASVGLLLVAGGVFVLVDIFSVHYLTARVLVAGVTGVFNYMANLFFNFKVAGEHL